VLWSRGPVIDSSTALKRDGCKLNALRTEEFFISPRLSGWRTGTSAGSKTAVLRGVAPCSLVEVYRRFRDACCLHHQGDHQPETSVNFYQTTRRNNPQVNRSLTHLACFRNALSIQVHGDRLLLISPYHSSPPSHVIPLQCSLQFIAYVGSVSYSINPKKDHGGKSEVSPNGGRKLKLTALDVIFDHMISFN
jgi:proteasome lid subunit RPN8/RPN11